MSKTFTSRPSAPARGRSASSSRPRGGHSLSQGIVGGDLGEARAQSHTRSTDVIMNTKSGDRDPVPQNAGRGRGSSRNSGSMYNRGYTSEQTSGTFSRNDKGLASRADTGQRCHYADGYTVFTPNERKRQQISQMAQKETQAYEQYKKSNACENLSFVGTLGGEMNQSQARAQQANAVRTQKFNRQMRQLETREARKTAEEKEIQAKKAEARRKAEQNSNRSLQRHAPAEEVRRKREEFLRRLEAKSSESEFSPKPSTSTQTNFPAQQCKIQLCHDKMKVKDQPSQSLVRKVISKDLTGSTLHDSGSVSAEKVHILGQASIGQASGESNRPHNADHEDEFHDDLTNLTAMFPDHDPFYLSDLLLQLGSVDEVMSFFHIDS